MESVALVAGSLVLTYRVRVENMSSDKPLYVKPQNILAVDRYNRSYEVSDTSTLPQEYIPVQPGETRVGTVVLSQPLPADDVGTVVQLRLGFGLSSVSTLTIDTLVPPGG